MTEEQLSALLRIKRFEQPPPQYFDQLLKDLHQRQRAELLRRPLWKIAVERVQTFFSEHSMGNLSYAGALASVMIVGVTAIGLLTSGGSTPAPVVAKITEKADQAHLGIQGAQPPLGNYSLPAAAPAGPSSAPRYIIDSRPHTYEPPATFNF